MIDKTWHNTFLQLERVTLELEKTKSYLGLSEFKPLWRIMKSIQLRYVPHLADDVACKLDLVVQRLEIREVVPTSYSEEEAVGVMERFGFTCEIDPDLFEVP